MVKRKESKKRQLGFECRSDRSCLLQFAASYTKMNLNATSEVGFDPQNNSENLNNTENNKNSENSNNDSDKWRAILETQNKNFLELIKLVKNDNTIKENKLLDFPKFNPDITGSDAAAWCHTVNLILENKQVDGSDLVVALSKCLSGSASQWLSTICFTGMKWCDFRELFVQRFGGIETPAAVISNILNSQPEQNECLSVFGSRLVTSLMSSWKDLSKEEIAISLTLAQVARVDKRLNRAVFTANISSRNELQQELKAFVYAKDEFRKDNTHVYPEAKRIKLSTNLKCHFCGKIGHKIAECRSRLRIKEISSQHNSTPSKRDVTTITCYKCGQPGHIASRCSSKRSAEGSIQQKRGLEKNVNMCVIDSKGVLEQSGESYPFYYDNGAECSLIKEEVAKKMSGKRYNSIVTLRGIGDGTIASTLQILTRIKIDNYNIEILFHVVPDNTIKYDIVIGSDILAMGYRVEVSINKVRIFKEKVVYVCSTADQFELDDVDTDLIGEQKDKLKTLLNNFKNNFIKGIPKSRISTGQCRIRLINQNKTVQRRPYRLSSEEREIVRGRIKELIEAKIIRPSASPFASPILLVRKKDGSDRMCVDYRELNANTIADKYPLPLISDQIARLGGANYFTCLDMASGYHQVPMDPDSIEYTAFVTPDGQYEYLTMPFGLKNAPSIFQRAVTKALGDLVYSFVIVYMDDIMIVASTESEALERLKIVLDILVKSGFSFNIKKCSFLKTCVQYLGYLVKAGELRPNPRKIKALTQLPPPKSWTQLRQFIGLASYFRQFIHKFSDIAKPLYQLLTAKNFTWKVEHEQIRQRIIFLLTNEPVLVIFNPEYPIELHCDASSNGYGAILLHRIEKKRHVVEYFSKRTTEVESRYHSYELETLAVVNAIKHFRHYLQGRQFEVFTDCNSLKATRTKIELTPRIHRWWAYLQSFDFNIQYREGKQMAHVDFFSRNPIAKDKIEEKHINLTEISSDWLLVEQQKDSEIVDLIRKLNNNELRESYADTYEIRKNILFRKVQRRGQTLCLPVVPIHFRWSVINNVHESIMHLGWEKTLDKVYDYFWFKNMAKYVRKFVGNCITCNISKPPTGKSQIELHPIPKVSEPWHTIHVDITGKLSGKNEVKEYVIVIIDAFTKFVLLNHTINIDSNSCIKAMRSAISLFGLPSRIIADQGRCFTGKLFVDFCAKQNIKLHLIATGASRANGQVERIMSTLKSMLTAVEVSKRSWQEALNEIQLAMNCTTNRVTKASPLELFIGKVVRPLNMSAIDIENNCNLSETRLRAAKNIEDNAHYEKQRFDSNKAKIIKFKIGDHVLLKSDERHKTKLEPKYKGPFQVAKILDNDRYLLKSLSSNRTYKYSHEYLRKMPNVAVPEELDFERGESSDDNEENLNENEEIVEKDGSSQDMEMVERDHSNNRDNEMVERDHSNNRDNEMVERDHSNNRDIEVVEKDHSEKEVTALLQMRKKKCNSAKIEAKEKERNFVLS